MHPSRALLTPLCPTSRAPHRPDAPGGHLGTDGGHLGTDGGHLGTDRSVLRASSGYFSSDGESAPSSPLATKMAAGETPATKMADKMAAAKMADKATQTASAAAQRVTHAIAAQHGAAASWRRLHPPGAMPADVIGRELRRIGDDYNRLLLHRRMAGERRDPDPLPPPLHHEPTVLLCGLLLLLLIGRIVYSEGGANSQD